LPKFFLQWLRELPDQQADELWEYFDGTELCDEEVITAIAEGHPDLAERLTNDPGIGRIQ